MCDFLVENPAVFIIKLNDLVNVTRALRDQGTLDEVRCELCEFELGSEFFDVSDQLFLWNAHQRILDSAIGQQWHIKMNK